jgi:hypothetical protein
MQDGHGREILRHRESGFIGASLLTGRSANLTAVVTRPTRYIAIGPEALRRLTFELRPARRPASSEASRQVRRVPPRRPATPLGEISSHAHVRVSFTRLVAVSPGW